MKDLLLSDIEDIIDCEAGELAEIKSIPKMYARQAIINALAVVVEEIIYEDMTEGKLNLAGLLHEAVSDQIHKWRVNNE
jgi:hypothetical protein